jgi:hypothetical protein
VPDIAKAGCIPRSAPTKKSFASLRLGPFALTLLQSLPDPELGITATIANCFNAKGPRRKGAKDYFELLGTALNSSELS